MQARDSLKFGYLLPVIFGKWIVLNALCQLVIHYGRMKKLFQYIDFQEIVSLDVSS